MVVGIVLFFIIGCEFFIGYSLKFRKKADKQKKAKPAEKNDAVKEETVE